jgi:hypothetical protein
MKDLRNDADYGYGGPDVDVTAMASRTEIFVDRMDELLDS